MSEENLKKDLCMSNFETELVMMAVSCIGLKENTAKRKAKKVFRKYSEIIFSSKERLDDIYVEREKIRNKYNTLKSGKVSYVNTSGAEGIILLKEIEQVEVRKNEVLLIMKSGREIVMGSDFKYLKELI
jgi:hypothetical protein